MENTDPATGTHPCPECGQDVPLYRANGVVPGVGTFEDFLLPKPHQAPCRLPCRGAPHETVQGLRPFMHGRDTCPVCSKGPTFRRAQVKKGFR
jgi:hypothetical protein